MSKEQYWGEGLFTQPEIDQLMNENRMPAIYLRRQWPVGEALEVSSYLGGLPTLPDNIVWPINPQSGAPLHFLAQIECSEMPRMTEGPNLPESGRLFFFADIGLDLNWAEEKSSPEVTRVIFAPGNLAAIPECRAPEDMPDINHQLCQTGGNYARTGQRFYPKWPVEPAIIDTYAQSENPFDKISNRDYAVQSRALTTGQMQELLPEIPRQAWIYEQLYPSTVEADPQTGERRAVSSLRVEFGGKAFPFCALVAKVVMKSSLRLSYKCRSDAVFSIGFFDSKERHITLTDDEILRRKKTKADLDKLRRFEAGLSKVFKAFCEQDDLSPLTPGATVSLVDWINAALRAGENLERIVKEAVHEALCGGAMKAVTNRSLHGKLPACLYDMFLDRIAPSPRHAKHMIFGAKSVDPNPTAGQGIRLLQLDSDYGLGFMFCDCGIIDYWISEEDLQAQRFDRAYGATAGG